MGTNFYTKTDERHVGKRSAAGGYCWDCRMTMCPGGESQVHMGRALPWEPGYVPWPKICPQCGAGESPETIHNSAAGRELGFNKSAPAAKRGVASCSSWTWAMNPDELEGYSDFVDEYGHGYTRAEFMAVLEECPIRFFDSIGVEFS